MRRTLLRVDWSNPDLDDIRDRLCEVDRQTGCWLWKRNRDRHGYARAYAFGSKIGVHRLLLAAKLGRPVRHLALHRCHRGCDGCVNPDHVYEGTRADNARDMVLAGRSARGERHHAAKLTRDDLPIIFDLRRRGLTQRAIGEQFGVTASAIRFVLSGRSWPFATQRLREELGT